MTAADGSVIPADGLIEILSVDENGKAVVKADLPLGSYYLKELSTDAHYLLNDEKYPVVFDYAGEDVEVVELQANDGNAIGNELIYGSVSGMKKGENGTGLAGALIGLFYTDSETPIMTVTSAEDGSFGFKDR